MENEHVPRTYRADLSTNISMKTPMIRTDDEHTGTFGSGPASTSASGTIPKCTWNVCIVLTRPARTEASSRITSMTWSANIVMITVGRGVEEADVLVHGYCD